MKKIVVFVLLILIVSTGIIMAEENDSNPGRNSVIIKADKVETTDDILVGKGNIVLLKGDTEINADLGNYYKEEKRAEIFDNVQLKHRKGEISSNSMIGWLSDDKYIFEENVVMLQSLEDGEFTLTAPYLELLQSDNTFEAKEGVVIDYKGRTLMGNNVFYNGVEETLELVEDVHIEEENGDWVKSSSAVFYLESGEFVASEGVELEIGL